MPTKPAGVYADGRGGWYFKADVGKDPATGKRVQITKRGYRTADAGRGRRELVEQADRGLVTARSAGLTVNELLDLYLDGLDADDKLSAKTRFDYRRNADGYIRPRLGTRKVRDVTPDVILVWQRALTKEGGTKNGKPLAANTVRLARAPLAGAFKLALASGVIAVNPMLTAGRPAPKRSIPRHWSPEQARTFLGLLEGDRTYRSGRSCSEPGYASASWCGFAGTTSTSSDEKRASSSSPRPSATSSSARRGRVATPCGRSTSTTGW